MFDMMTILKILFVVMLCVPIACLVVWQISQLKARVRQEEKENAREARIAKERAERARYRDPYYGYDYDRVPGRERSSSRDRRGKKKRRSKGRVDRDGRPLY